MLLDVGVGLLGVPFERDAPQLVADPRLHSVLTLYVHRKCNSETSGVRNA